MLVSVSLEIWVFVLVICVVELAAIYAGSGSWSDGQGVSIFWRSRNGSVFGLQGLFLGGLFVLFLLDFG